MTAVLVYTVRCDGCGADMPTTEGRSPQARAAAQAQGWRVIKVSSGRGRSRIVDHCPACTKEGDRG